MPLVDAIAMRIMKPLDNNGRRQKMTAPATESARKKFNLEKQAKGYIDRAIQ